DWDSFSITLSEGSVGSIESVLSAYSEVEIQKMIDRGSEVYKKYFSVDQLHQTILYTLSDSVHNTFRKSVSQPPETVTHRLQKEPSGCCVIVPLHRSDLSDDEWVALRNNRKILKNYPFVAVAPAGLDLSPITDEIEFQEVKWFDRTYFKSPQTYNKLMILPEFWDVFASYENVLIAQLDVLIFSNDLEAWCHKGYAYVGAPWLNGFGANNILSVQILARFMRCSAGGAQALHRQLREIGVIDGFDQLQLDWRKAMEEFKYPESDADFVVGLSTFLHEMEQNFHSFVGVGNGGLSLRRVDKARELFKSTAIVDDWSCSTPEMENYPLIKHDLDKMKVFAAKVSQLNGVVVSLLKKQFSGHGDLASKVSQLPNYLSQNHDEVYRQLLEIRARLDGDLAARKAVEIIDKFRVEIISFVLQKINIPEDFFWGEIAPHFVDDYRVASVEEALQFSFECNPAYCYERNGRQLPFGCHAWQLPKNRTFWEPIVAKIVGPYFKQVSQKRETKMLDIRKLYQKFNIFPRGILHIGAHEGEEIGLYEAMKVLDVLYVEANPAVYAKLVHNLAGRNHFRSVNCAISDEDGEVGLNVTSMDQSSSILPLKKHAELDPDIVKTHSVKVPGYRVDTLLKKLEIPAETFNVIHIDIQGSELKVLKGAIETLPYVDAVMTEVNYEELYPGCALIYELDDFLEQNGFERVATITPYDPSWGDALYIRKKQFTMNSIGFFGTLVKEF
ncbi:FkbM family methyltransferase, partial [bacterium]|nr:FkbM family methyltransferase [bacterium]